MPLSSGRKSCNTNTMYTREWCNHPQVKPLILGGKRKTWWQNHKLRVEDEDGHSVMILTSLCMYCAALCCFSFYQYNNLNNFCNLHHLHYCFSFLNCKCISYLLFYTLWWPTPNEDLTKSDENQCNTSEEEWEGIKRGQQQGQSVRSQKKTEKGNKMKHISVRTVHRRE